MSMDPKHRSIRRTFWASEELWEKIGIAARLDGRSVSSWLRSRSEMALAKEIRRVISPPEKNTNP